MNGHFSRVCAWVCQDSHKQRIRAACATLQRHFTEHPHETKETYGEHLLFTIKMSARILACGVLLPIHGVFPFMFKLTTSNQMRKIQGILEARKKKTYDGLDPGI